MQKTLRKNLLLSAGAVLAVLALLFVLDRALLQSIAARQDYQWLIFEPHSKYHYRTSEFRMASFINNLGFRGKSCTLRKSPRYRILALGDSFTFGWGVDIDDAWPQRLEANLRKKGVDAEVLNLGKAGADPHFYAELAQTAIPMLKPDLVLVGLLQGDDFISAHPLTSSEIAAQGGRLYRLDPPPVKLLRALYPGLVQILEPYLRRPGVFSESLTTEEAKARANTLLDAFSPEHRERFDRLPQDVRALFLEGSLNPLLIKLAVDQPGFYAFPFTAAPEILQVHSAELQRLLSIVQSTSQAHNAKCAVLSVPHGAYLSEITANRVRRLGFALPEIAATSPLPDQLVAEVCVAAQIPCKTVDRAQFQQENPDALFYPYDLHYTPEGHARLAALITDWVEAQL